MPDVARRLAERATATGAELRDRGASTSPTATVDLRGDQHRGPHRSARERDVAARADAAEDHVVTNAGPLPADLPLVRAELPPADCRLGARVARRRCLARRARSRARRRSTRARGRSSCAPTSRPRGRSRAAPTTRPWSRGHADTVRHAGRARPPAVAAADGHDRARRRTLRSRRQGRGCAAKDRRGSPRRSRCAAARVRIARTVVLQSRRRARRSRCARTGAKLRTLRRAAARGVAAGHDHRHATPTARATATARVTCSRSARPRRAAGGTARRARGRAWRPSPARARCGRASGRRRGGRSRAGGCGRACPWPRSSPARP